MSCHPSGAPARRRLCLLFTAAVAAPAYAAAEAPPLPAGPDILVIAQKQSQTIENAPSSRATVDAATLARTVNAFNVEDSVKYLPGLIVRKRHIGDTQAPLATRTSGLGASARSLIYADGALLSALIGNNNTSASPRWSLVSPQEIARIDVLYGPFSAAYPGNSLGAVVNITTRLPDKLEATLASGFSAQTFDQYGTHRTLPSWQIGGTLGARFGPLAIFLSEDHVASKSQPLSYVTVNQPAGSSTAGTPVTGAFAGVNRTGQPIQLLGASGFEHQVQDHLKFKAALDLTPSVRLTYVGGLFLNDTAAHAQSYLRDAGGTPVYVGALNIAGRAYAVAPGAFSGGVYTYDERHWSHALSASGNGGSFDWQLIGTLYDFAHDVQRTPTAALTGASQSGGGGNTTRLDGTGWRTADARGAWKSDGAGTHILSAGAHYDRFEIDSNRYTTALWRHGPDGALNLQSQGKTRTVAVWAQDAWRLTPAVTLTIGGRQEWWKAYDGRNFSASPAISRDQPTRSDARFSPKASLAWVAAPGWTARLSFGQAWRFPTVGELYQIVTTPIAAVPNPDLRPERARSEELAIEHRDGQGLLRLSLFNESVKDALLSQTGPLNGTATLATFVQNVDRTRVRGIELAADRHDVVRNVDVSGSVTYADGTTRKDNAFPDAVGKLLPQVPHWKASLVTTWRPAEPLSLTAAARFSSRLWGTLNNADVVGNTWQGFYKYFVVDLRARYALNDHLTASLGVDNVNNDKYFLFHPFPQRSFVAELGWKL
ncbi:TonB-dependent receptor [Sphingomonas crusticola]|uniref:TonB-dependent receptor n=1 Tax=Sphingomonas crusticola TaxID=1697973 RepID=UPI000E27C737|nr:TonB-dependent receptor [Sphingomonas crusticola]